MACLVAGHQTLAGHDQNKPIAVAVGVEGTPFPPSLWKWQIGFFDKSTVLSFILLCWKKARSLLLPFKTQSADKEVVKHNVKLALGNIVVAEMLLLTLHFDKCIPEENWVVVATPVGKWDQWVVQQTCDVGTDVLNCVALQWHIRFLISCLEPKMRIFYLSHLFQCALVPLKWIMSIFWGDMSTTVDIVHSGSQSKKVHHHCVQTQSFLRTSMACVHLCNKNNELNSARCSWQECADRSQDTLTNNMPISALLVRMKPVRCDWNLNKTINCKKSNWLFLQPNHILVHHIYPRNYCFLPSLILWTAMQFSFAFSYWREPFVAFQTLVSLTCRVINWCAHLWSVWIVNSRCNVQVHLWRKLCVTKANDRSSQEQRECWFAKQFGRWLSCCDWHHCCRCISFPPKKFLISSVLFLSGPNHKGMPDRKFIPNCLVLCWLCLLRGAFRGLVPYQFWLINYCLLHFKHKSCCQKVEWREAFLDKNM